MGYEVPVLKHTERQLNSPHPETLCDPRDLMLVTLLPTFLAVGDRNGGGGGGRGGWREGDEWVSCPLPCFPVPYLLCVSECGFRAYRTSFYSFSREEASTTEICHLTLAMQDWPICELPREYFRGRSLLWCTKSNQKLVVSPLREFGHKVLAIWDQSCVKHSQTVLTKRGIACLRKRRAH